MIISLVLLLHHHKTNPGNPGNPGGGGNPDPDGFAKKAMIIK